VLATRNAHKVTELSRILATTGVAVSLVGLDAYPEMPEVAETGFTFADNALLKARAVAEFTGLPAVADDSGLCVDALHGMPGIFSARWSGGHGDDKANLDLLLAQLSDVSERGAQFVCVAALALPLAAAAAAGRREWTVTGVLSGSLARERRGTGGFGYDPVFLPTGSSVTTAELTPEDKDLISHRGRALRALAPVIAEHAQSLPRVPRLPYRPVRGLGDWRVSPRKASARGARWPGSCRYRPSPAA
jgi:XTP/dITP diphosphohydrolase